MCSKTLGERRGHVDASARRRAGVENDEQIFVTHDRPVLSSEISAIRIPGTRTLALI